MEFIPPRLYYNRTRELYWMTNMNHQALAKKICEEGLKSAQSYANYFLENQDAITDSLKGFSGVKTDIFVQPEEPLDWIKYSTIFSDITSVFLGMGKQGGSLHSLFSLEKQIDLKLTLPKIIYDGIARYKNKPIIFPAVLVPKDEILSVYLKTLEPLIDAGRIIVRPKPVAVYKVDREKANTDWVTFDIDPYSQSGTLIALQNSKEVEAIPIRRTETKSAYENELFEISFPFVEGVDISELVKILDDEQDRILTFRAALRKVVKEAASEEFSTSELLNDIIRPEVSKLERRFNTVVNYHKLKSLGATIGTATLVLASLTTEGWLASVTGLLGACGLGLLTDIYADYVKARDEVKENPYYLFWKLSKVKR